KQQEINFATQISNSPFAIYGQTLQRQNQAQEVYLERQKEHDLQNQALTETQKYQLSEKYRVLEGKQKVKEFHQEQELNIAKATMEGALAIVKAYAEEGPIVASAELPFLIGETALQIGVIAAEKPPAYAKGGLHYESDGRGGVLPGYSKTDNTNAYLRSGEGIVVSEAMQVPWARQLVSAINQSYGGRPFEGTFGPGFASGGIFNSYLPTIDNGLRPQLAVASRLHPDDIHGIVAGLTNAINNMPPPVVDVKDINYQQQRLATVQDRSRR